MTSFFNKILSSQSTTTSITQPVHAQVSREASTSNASEASLLADPTAPSEGTSISYAQPIASSSSSQDTPILDRSQTLGRSIGATTSNPDDRPAKRARPASPPPPAPTVPSLSQHCRRYTTSSQDSNASPPPPSQHAYSNHSRSRQMCSTPVPTSALMSQSLASITSLLHSVVEVTQGLPERYDRLEGIVSNRLWAIEQAQEREAARNERVIQRTDQLERELKRMKDDMRGMKRDMAGRRERAEEERVDTSKRIESGFGEIKSMLEGLGTRLVVAAPPREEGMAALAEGSRAGRRFRDMEVNLREQSVGVSVFGDVYHDSFDATLDTTGPGQSDHGQLGFSIITQQHQGQNQGQNQDQNQANAAARPVQHGDVNMLNTTTASASANVASGSEIQASLESATLGRSPWHDQSHGINPMDIMPRYMQSGSFHNGDTSRIDMGHYNIPSGDAGVGDDFDGLDEIEDDQDPVAMADGEDSGSSTSSNLVTPSSSNTARRPISVQKQKGKEREREQSQHSSRDTDSDVVAIGFNPSQNRRHDPNRHSDGDRNAIGNGDEPPVTPQARRPRRATAKVVYRSPTLKQLQDAAAAELERKKKTPQLNYRNRRPSVVVHKPKKGPKTTGKRTFYGKVFLTTAPLSMSDGQKRGEGLWPNKGPNTVKGNMQEISCDGCKGRAHWACAGFNDDAEPPDNWDCPDCDKKLKSGTARQLIKTAPQDKCIRSNCIRRDKQKMITQDGDEDEYYVERFVGRRAVGRKKDSTERIFEYLVKWLGWPMDDCTWEPEENLQQCSTWRDQFLQECVALEITTKKRVAMLPETKRFWDEVTGNRIGENEDGEDESEGRTSASASVVPIGAPIAALTGNV